MTIDLEKLAEDAKRLAVPTREVDHTTEISAIQARLRTTLARLEANVAKLQNGRTARA